MKIFFWSADSSGCGYYRCHLPAQALAAKGYNTLAQSVMPDQWTDADVIVGQRVLLPGPTIRWQQFAKSGKSKLVYEIDDDLLGVDVTNRAAWDLYSRSAIQVNIKRNIAVADLVTVTTPYLAEVVSEHNSNIAVLPNSVPSWLIDAPSPNIEDGSVTIGWGGGVSHRMDWREAESEVARFVTRNRDTEMHMMGWAPPELWRRLPVDRRRFTTWIENMPDYYRSIDFHIGLAPLRAHTFNRSKSPIKAIELAALGIPSICSNFGPYSEVVRHGETGFLARQPHEWATYLRELLDPEVRRVMGEKARAIAAEHTIERNIELWEKALT